MSPLEAPLYRELPVIPNAAANRPVLCSALTLWNRVPHRGSEV
jgi:hypothetical protein